MRAGQFSIFGASEEKDDDGFPGLGLIKQWLKSVALGARDGGSFLVGREKFGGTYFFGDLIVHRACTGNAERQLSVPSSVYRVPGISSQLNAL
jgi:hypothetical protein